MHKTIWFKIHFILGLTAGLVLLVVGTSGAILSFEKEILKAINKDSYEVSVPNSAKLSTKELLEKFQVKMPDTKVSSISFSSEPEDSTVLNVTSKENRKGINYYINPYTAEILPDIVGRDFFSFNLRLHRWLAFSGDAREVGKQAVAISTVALIILAISGVIIYWGRIKRAFFKSFTFTTKHHGRAFLSTMHSAVGMWVLPFYLLASLTGLYWSYGWYNDMLYKIAGVEKPQRMQQQAKPEGQAESEKPEGEKAQRTENKAEKPEGEKVRAPKQEKSNFDEYQKAVDMFNVFVQKDYSKVTLRFPQKGSVYSFSYLDTNPDHYRASNSLELDVNSWQLLKHERYEDKPLNEQLMRSILPLHTGEYFGIIGQIGMFIASAAMSLFTITGFMLYFNRTRKKKKK
jgi:sulfite reductase (NADPH) flavoprotein alpha-component